MLCIDSRYIEVCPKVQKSIDLGELLNNHTKHFDTEKEAIEEQFYPLDFAVTLRSMYSNKVMQIRNEDGIRYYTNFTQIPPFVHKGYDLVMYLSSLGIIKNVEYSPEFEKIMMEHTQFQCIGLYNPSIINPIIYSHVIISDEGAKMIEKYFREGVSFVDIDSMKRYGNLPALLDEIIVVKENQNVSNNN